MQVQSSDINAASIQAIRQPLAKSIPVDSQSTDINLEPVKKSEIDNTEIEQDLEEVDKNVEIAIEQIKVQIEDAGYNVSVRKDDRVNGFIATIVDKETGQVIKELPPKEIIELRASINEKVKGLLLDEKG